MLFGCVAQGDLLGKSERHPAFRAHAMVWWAPAPRIVAHRLGSARCLSSKREDRGSSSSLSFRLSHSNRGCQPSSPPFSNRDCPSPSPPPLCLRRKREREKIEVVLPPLSQSWCHTGGRRSWRSCSWRISQRKDCCRRRQRRTGGLPRWSTRSHIPIPARS
jgi:hypothetical protein